MKANIIDTTKIDTTFIEEQAESWKMTAAAVSKTAAAYLADVEHRADTLKAQAKEYQEEMATLKKERDTLAVKIADLSSRGDIDAAAEADVKLEALDQKIHALGRKLKIVNSAAPKGDPHLYAAAQAAHEAMEAERAPYKQRIDELTTAVDAEIKRLEAIKRELSFKRDTDHGYYAAQKWQKVDRHYRDLDRIEREAEEKAAAERKAQAAAAGHTRYTYTG